MHEHSRALRTLGNLTSRCRTLQSNLVGEIRHYHGEGRDINRNTRMFPQAREDNKLLYTGKYIISLWIGSVTKSFRLRTNICEKERVIFGLLNVLKTLSLDG